MSDAYRRLCEGLPPRRAPDKSSFPTDPRRVKAWVEALPRANQAATYKQLLDALESLSEIHLDGAARLAALEALRGPVMEAIAALEMQCQGGGIPLSAAKARSFDQLYQFERLMARCYRLAAIEYCAPSGSVPLLRGGSVATCLVRAAHHSARCLILSYFLYHQPAAGCWAGLHAVHGFAASCKLDEKSVEEPTEKRSTSVQQIYLQSLLVALSNPYRFSQREQAEFWNLAAQLVSFVSLSASGDGDDAHPVPATSDAGPGYTAGERADEGGVWIDLSRLRQQIEQALQGNDRDLIVLRFKGSGPTEVSTDLLRRIIGGWGRASSRLNQRMSAGHELETVLGLGSLHFHLSGMLDFDTFLGRAGVSEDADEQQRAAWTRAPVDAGRIPVHRANVVDQSLGGYHLHWDTEEGIKARVGELIGLAISSMEDGRHWLLGILRWLRFSQDGSVDAGIQLISRYPRPVAIRNLTDDAGRQAHRAIEFRPLKEATNRTLYFAAPSNLSGQAGRLQVLRVAESSDIERPVPLKVQAGETARLEESGDFVLLTAEEGRA